MRVPSIGQPLYERQIVREGMRIAEHMLRNYHDKPSLDAQIIGFVRQAFGQVQSVIRMLARG